MKRTFALCFAAVAALGPLAFAQGKDGQSGDIDAQIQKAEDAADAAAKKAEDASDAAAKKGVTIPEVKDTADDDDAREKARTQAAVNAKGPVALPSWTPAVPQFTASGPAARKLVDGEARIVLAGTSPLAPEALADAWDAFKKPGFSHERTGSEFNGLVDLNVSFRNGEDGTEVKMEVERKAGAKVTKVTLSSPISLPQ